MWSKADELRLSVVMGLPQGSRLIRWMRRALTEARAARGGGGDRGPWNGVIED
jgi:hypothetical protein